MKKTKTPITNPADLRKKAEAKFKANPKKAYPELVSIDGKKLIHELEVHQIELEMQNEELKSSREKGEALLEKYTDLYDFSPGGYFTVNKEGIMTELNLAAAALIGKERSKLVNKNIRQFISTDTRLVFSEFIDNVFEIDGKISCEAVFSNNGTNEIQIHIDGVCSKDNSKCQLVVSDITDRKIAEALQIKTSKELRLLMHHLQNVREEERKRIGRELHDQLGQQLTAIKMYTAWVIKKNPVEQVEIKDKLNSIMELLDSSNFSMRKILNELRVGVLDNDGLIDGLRWLCQQFEESTDVELDFITKLDKVKVNEATAVCVFRVLQESLNNITKHAAAKKIKIAVSMALGKLTMIIKDDGKGFDVGALQTVNSFGILGMKERVAAIEGEFNLESKKGAGTQLTISVPV